MSDRWKEVHEQLLSITQRRCALDAEEARWLREAEAIEIWKPFGMVNMVDYMERVVGYAARTAQERLRVARALASLPELEAALRGGVIPHSAVRELARVATRATESAWLVAARGKNLRQIEQLVFGHEPGDRPEDPPKASARLHTVTFSEVAAAVFAQFREARKVLQEQHGSHMTDSEVLGALAAAVLGGARVGAQEHDGRAAHQINYTVCKICDRAWQNGAGAMVPVPPSALEQARCDAIHIGATDGEGPERAKQDIPPAMVRFIHARDEHRCQTPGCRSTIGLQIHHIKHREHGGTHDAWNLTLRCFACHSAHHEGLLSISGTAPDNIVTLRLQEPRPSGIPWTAEANAAVDPVPVSARAPSAVPVAVPTPPPAPVAVPVAEDVPETVAPAPVAAPAQTRSISPAYEAAVTRADAITAMRTLGWGAGTARQAVDETIIALGSGATINEILREALRRAAIRK